MGPDGFVLGPENPAIGLRKYLKIGARLVDITELASPLTIEPTSGRPRLYAIAQFRRVAVYRDFARFAERVAELLGGGSKMHGLYARGAFEPDATTLEANYVVVSIR
jgi:hypothetical protein